MNAQISRDGNIVAADVDVDVCVTKRGGRLEWSGSFSIPHDFQFDGNEYILELADGRSGQIIIHGASIAGGSSTKRLRFQVTGPLQ